MCERLSALRQAMAGYAATFDPALLAAADVAKLVDDAASIEKMAATVKALAAARVADSGWWRQSGDRSAAHRLARTTGTSVNQAVEVIDTARRLQTLPEVAAAARRGELSAQQTSAIADAAAADPSAESVLVGRYQRASLAELRLECARVKAVAEPDLEARRARIHRSRYLRSYSDAEGAWHMHVRGNPEVGARIMATLAPITDRLFRAARAEGRRESPECYAADALVELATGAGVKGGREQQGAGVKIIARVDLPALMRGYPVADETCEIVGFGPVAVSAIRDLIECDNPFLAALATNGKQVLGVAHLGRRPNAHQRTALEWLFPACTVLGCPTQAHLEIDHRIEWADSHVTLLDWLDGRCKPHHRLKTRFGWALAEGTGKRPLVAPEDPRYPRNQRPPPKTGAGAHDAA